MSKSKTPRHRPRKSPSQARSRETVQVIVTATRRLIEQRGIEGLTTNHVAVTAGVSIGSIYQYFPAKEALVGAVIESLADELETEVRSRVSLSTVGTTKLQALVDGYVLHFRARRRCYRAVLPEVVRLGRAGYLEASTARLARELVAALDGHGSELRGFLTLSALQGALERIVLLDDDRLDATDLPLELGRLFQGSSGFADRAFAEPPPVAPAVAP